MSEKKKDLKAFLSKQSKKGKKPAAAADPEKPPEEETKADAEVIKKDQPVEQSKKVDSDEEVDDAEETGMDLGFAKIKELKDIKQDTQQDEIEKKGYGFDESAKAQSKAKDSIITRNTKNAGDITFGGSKPKFGRKKANNQIDGFDEGLDDIDDDGKIKKNKGSKNTSSAKDDGPGLTGAAGGREFIHFGSKPREHKDNANEENKEEVIGFKTTGVKPTFKRREPREFKNTNNEDEVRPSYDFKVSYKTSHNDKEDGEKKERRPRDQKDKGVPLETFNKKNTGDDDEFTFVTGKQKRGVKKNNEDSDDDNNDGFKIERGGRSGRGGFFKNSKKAD